MLRIISSSVVKEVKGAQLTAVQWCCLALYAVAFSCAAVVSATFLREHRDYNSQEFRLETEHLGWESAVPAVSVCPAADGTDYATSVAPSTASALDLERASQFVAGLASPRGRYCDGCDQPCDLCPRADYLAVVDKVIGRCESVFKRCLWNDKEFDCCSNFKSLATRGGRCFAINSKQTDRSPMADQLVVSSWSKRGEMRLILKLPAAVQVHDAKDVGFVRRRPTGRRTEILYRFREVRADEDARGLRATEQRSCVLPGERPTERHAVYSRSACRTECTARRQLAVCGCVHHLLRPPANTNTCDYEGLKCLDQHFRENRKETQLRLRRRGVRCDCPPECDQTDVTVVRHATLDTEDAEISATITLTSPPTERLTVTSRVNWLDTLVGVACLSRLLTSASLPSVFEALCLLCRRLHARLDRRNRPATDVEPTSNRRVEVE